MLDLYHRRIDILPSTTVKTITIPELHKLRPQITTFHPNSQPFENLS